MPFIFPPKSNFTQKNDRKPKKNGHQYWCPIKRGGNTRKPYGTRIARLAELYTLIFDIFTEKGVAVIYIKK
jgi:hypothetical protein